mgnify:CR=1 FL=1
MWKYFKDLERTMSVRELNDLASEIAEAYADRESAGITKSDLAEENDMTVKLISELLDYAVVHSLVSGATVSRMERRALENQKKHSPDGERFSAKAHYSELRKKRVEQEVFSFSESRINELAVSFADETDKSKEDFAIRYGVEKKTVDIILKKAITESICSDEVFRKIEERSIRKNDTPETRDFFKKLHERREAKRKNFFA